jgi:hypothetical protein
VNLDELLVRFPGAQRSGNGYAAKCPAHEDNRASLSIGQADDGKLLVHCHAGCEASAIVAALGLHLSDLMPPRDAPARPARKTTPMKVYRTANEAVADLERRHGRRSASWTYHDQAGEPVGLAIRWDSAAGKDIRPVSRNGQGWLIKGMPAPRPLYRLPDLAQPTTVWVLEGEKCVDLAHELGLIATTSAGGAKAPHKTAWTPLAGKTVFIVPDHDEAGRKYSADVAAILTDLDPRAIVRIVELPGLATGEDLVEYVAARRGAGLDDAAIRAEVEDLAAKAQPYCPETNATETTARGPRAHVSDWADEFIRRAIAPTWHRDRKTLFSSTLNAEVAIASLWHHLDVADLDALKHTVELARSESFANRLKVAKDLLPMAAARIIRSLPEAADVERDPTIRADDLRDRLIAWLIRPRAFRNDNGVIITVSYFGWVNELPPEADHWRQCFADPVFGRIDGHQPRIGTQGAAFAHELHYPSCRQLLRDLRACALAEDAAFKIAGRTWRGVEMSSAVLNSVARGDQCCAT